MELLDERVLCAPTVCGDYEVSTNIVSSGRVQLTAVCTNPKCLSWTTTVANADAGSLDRCLGSSVFPLYTKQQPSERKLRFTMENLLKHAIRGTPGVTSRILHSIAS